MKLHLPSGKVVLARDPVDENLALGDAHVVLAVQMKLGILPEDEVTISCFNCDHEITLRPCALLEIAPWVDDEAHHEELDRTLPFGEPHAIPPMRMGRVRIVRTVTLRPLTLAEARTGELGVAALGRERDPAKIDAALRDDPSKIAPVWLASHYVPRLFASVLCPSCKARNDVDAPYERELSYDPEEHDLGDFPSFDEWDTVVRELAVDWPEDVELLTVEGEAGTDVGGDTTWGIYEEPRPDGMPAHPARVTLFYRTFASVWAEEGEYDWRAEIAETLEHELEHHEAFLRGWDAEGEAEHAQVAEEAMAVIGKREVRRRAVSELGDSVGDFWRRTWILWLVLFIASAVVWYASNHD